MKIVQPYNFFLDLGSVWKSASKTLWNHIKIKKSWKMNRSNVGLLDVILLYINAEIQNNESNSI